MVILTVMLSKAKHEQCFLPLQIIEDIQNFYAESIKEDNNGTMIQSYNKVVRKY